MSFNVEEIRAQFPALKQEVNGRPLVYLDSAATTQKPQAVIDAIVHYYQHDNANVHRAAHALSGRATSAFEDSRRVTAEFLGCANPAQIIWVRGVTEAINLVAASWGRSNLAAGDKVLVSAMEHHSDIVPWQLIGCDFYAFSGHKLFGPTGIGVLWGREALLEAMPPFLGGGEMIDRVSFDGTTFNRLPFKFEAGTPNIAGVIGLGAAVRWVQGLDRGAAEEHEQQLLRRCDELAESVRGLRRLGPERNRVGVFSFLLEGTHPEDLGTLLDQQGIAIRTGHHCAQPLMSRFEVPGTARASFSLYNTLDEVEALFAGLAKIQELFA
ncbi:MAG: aminotransferase class V-fold PLP-dependent enzyme [Gammaproteobacteria bacterium]|nr:aminotransferase class V-fold PLP-dependent enzyme [Gammaproteobacteria bacterium]